VVRALGGGTTNVFEPAEVRVGVGETVVWSDESGSHTVTFEAAIDGGGARPDSGNLDPGQHYTLTFPSPGAYEYRCIYHSSGFGPGKGMVGKVVVA
jgi:plastocyanin